MKLHELKPAKGSSKESRRKGRGPGSGWGKTAGRGQDGQKSRSGGGKGPHFEGGQMPLTMRIPKRGFHNRFATIYSEVNVEQLNKFEKDTVITPELLKETGVVSKLNDGVKILGNGDLTVALTVKVQKFSKSAVEKIEAAGGKAEVI